jgi:hypothetical protein
MKRLFFIPALFVLFSVGSMGQGEQKKEITIEDRSKMFVSRLAQKVVLTKNQKDSITMIYTQFMEDIQKYHAENNAKVITYLMKSRDDKIKTLLHDDTKYDQYLLFMEDIKKQREPSQKPPEPQQNGGQRNPMGNGRGM